MIRVNNLKRCGLNAIKTTKLSRKEKQRQRQGQNTDNGRMTKMLSSVPKEALTHPDLRHRQVAGLLHQGVRQHDGHGQHEAPAPRHTRVDHVLQVCRAFPRHFCSDEGPAEVETHDGHPREHANGEEVADKAEYLANQEGE